jgi:hypothetical protein
MTYRGQIRNGVVVLEGQPPLEEGTVVTVEPVTRAEAAEEPLPTLAELFKDLAGKAVGLPEDMAENHDHYLHGTPKRSKS